MTNFSDSCTVFESILVAPSISFIPFADLVLSNKLVLYDLENQLIGWTEYNCK